MAQSVRLQDAVDQYEMFRKADDVKQRTVENDMVFLRALILETGNVLVRNIDIQHVQRLFAAKGESWGVATRNLAKGHLGGFFKYCRNRGWMPRDRNPVESFKRRKPAPRKHLRVPASRFKEMLDAAEHPRDRAFLACGLFMFLRPSETTTLRLCDVDLDSGYVSVTIHKTSTLDQMPVSSELDVELRRYLTWYAGHHPLVKPEWLLIPSKMGGNFSRDTDTGRYLAVDETASRTATLRPYVGIANPEQIAQKVLEKMGYPTDREGGHTLRRSGARAYFDELCAQGYSRALKRISAMLHHQSVQTTEIYLGLDVDLQERDLDVRGKPMFPGLAAPNVVTLRQAAP